MGKTLTRFIRSSCKLEHTKGTQIDAKEKPTIKLQKHNKLLQKQLSKENSDL